MNALELFVFFAALVAVNGGILVPSEKILQGPSSKTTLVGPDGSVISSVAPGGQVIADESLGAVAQGAPIVSVKAAPIDAVPIVATPVVTGPIAAAPAVAAPVAAVPIIAAPVALDALHGESGAVVEAPGPVADGKLLVLPGVPAGHGHEGQYVHDNTETLYDDGSYKAQ